jgi:hypothetical protein
VISVSSACHAQRKRGIQYSVKEQLIEAVASTLFGDYWIAAFADDDT